MNRGEGEREREKERERERERLRSEAGSTFSQEPDTGIHPNNPEVMT